MPADSYDCRQRKIMGKYHIANWMQVFAVEIVNKELIQISMNCCKYRTNNLTNNGCKLTNYREGIIHDG